MTRIRFIRAIRFYSWLAIRGGVAVAGADGGAFWQTDDLDLDMAIGAVAFLVGRIIAERVLCTDLVGDALERGAGVGQIARRKDLAAARFGEVVHLKIGYLVETLAHREAFEIAQLAKVNGPLAALTRDAAVITPDLCGGEVDRG